MERNVQEHINVVSFYLSPRNILSGKPDLYAINPIGYPHVCH